MDALRNEWIGQILDESKFAGFTGLGNQRKRRCLKQAYDTLDFFFGEQPPIPSLGKLVIYNFKKYFFVHVNRGVIRGSKGGVNGRYTGIGAE